MPRYLLVDGHSVIFSWPELRAVHGNRQGRAQARETLIKELRQLHDMGSWEITVVFDGQSGTGPQVPDARHPGDLVVAYSRKDQTADSIIEALVASQKDRESVTVITADEAERAAVEGLGAFCLSPDWLRGEMKSVRNDFNEDLRRRKPQRW